MSDNRNRRRMLRWTTLGGLLAATIALSATPAAAEAQFDPQSRYWTDQNGSWNHPASRYHRHHRHYDNNGYGYRYYRERPRYYEAPPAYYYEAPPAYYYEAPPPRYYDPSFSFGLTIPIH
jgi:hypothetical protein